MTKIKLNSNTCGLVILIRHM